MAKKGTRNVYVGAGERKGKTISAPKPETKDVGNWKFVAVKKKK